MLIESCCFWRVTLTRDTWHVGVTRSRMRAHAHCAVTHTLSEFCLENFQAEFRLTVFLAWFHAECVHCVSLAAYTFCHRVCHCACVCLVFWMRFCVQEAVTCRFELVRRHHTPHCRDCSRAASTSHSLNSNKHTCDVFCGNTGISGVGASRRYEQFALRVGSHYVQRLSNCSNHKTCWVCSESKLAQYLKVSVIR